MVDSELNVVPAMADNFRVSSDGLTYLFRLQEGARWSDGEPLTAEDFAYAWRRMRELETKTAFLMEDVETAEALDDRTLEVRLREPRSYFPYILSSPWAFPWPRHRCEELGDEWAKPANLVGNGPYALVEFDAEHALLRANPHWTGPHGNVREIHFSFYSKGEEMIERWREGSFDLLHVYFPIPEEEPETLCTLVPELGLQYIGFRADRPPFNNGLVRKAFSHAVDRELLVATYGALARAATRGGAIPPAMPAHSHRIGPEYDLELARELLDEAGYPDGKGLPELEMIVPHWLQPLDAISELWKPIGARVNVRPIPKHIAGESLEDAHLWWSGWTADYPDPDGFFRGLLTMGWPFYRDDDILELLDLGRSLRDQGERMRVYHEVDRLWVAEHAAILPVAYPRSVLLRRPWIEGLWASPLSRAHLDAVVVGERAEA
jgi:oligopeptide transport system substrate-binding protein